MSSTQVWDPVTRTYVQQRPWDIPPEPVLPTERMFGLKLIPLDRQYGLTCYKVTTDPKEIASDESITIVKSYDDAMKRLSRGTQAPDGTTRLFLFEQLSNRVQKSLPHDIRKTHSFADFDNPSYPAKSKLLFTTDTPAITTTDPSRLSSLLKTWKALPTTLSEPDLSALLEKAPYLSVRKARGMMGLPVITQRRLRADGKLPASPQSAVNKRRASFLAAHHAIALSLHTRFIELLDTALLIRTGVPAPFPLSDSLLLPEHNAYLLLTDPSEDKKDVPGYHCRFSSPSKKNPTWANTALLASTWSSAVSTYLNSILSCSWPTTPRHLDCPHGADTFYPHFSQLKGHYSYGSSPSDFGWARGPFRSLPIFLSNFPARRRQVLEALSLYSPLIPLLKVPIPKSPKGSTQDARECADQALALHSSLYHLTRVCGARTYPSLPTSHLYKGPLHES